MLIHKSLTAPTASESVHSHADYLELLALQSDDRNSSYQDLVSALRQSGSLEAIRESKIPDRGSELSQVIADSAMSELDTRARSSGPGYPFTVSDQHIQLRSSDDEFGPYIFQLLLTRYGVSIGPRDLKPSNIFEELSASVAAEYLGGEEAEGVASYHFGFPRRLKPNSFEAALNDLCAQLNEGLGAKTRPSLRYQKDAKLDLVAWRGFPDGRCGKLIAFGQCATGDRYDGKETELIPRRFHSLWMREPLRLDPLLFFFVPRCLDDEEWEALVLANLILFDRCRITALATHSKLPAALRQRVQRWNKNVLDKKLRAP